MLLCGIIDELSKAMSSTVASRPAFVFCEAADNRLNSATAILRGLLWMLICQHPTLVSHVQEKYKHAGKKLFQDSNAWYNMLPILENMLDEPILEGKIMIIDALDECEKDLDKLLKFLSTVSRAKWVVSSRPLPNIEYSLQKTKAQLCLELNSGVITDAVHKYIHHKVARLAHHKKWEDSLQKAVEKQMGDKAKETFLWVALVCQELDDPEIEDSDILDVLETFPPGLDPVYQRMIDTVSRGRHAARSSEILALTSVVYRPLSTKELICLMKSSQFGSRLASPEKMISSCGSFLALRNDTVFFIHQTARQFLLDKACGLIMPSGIAHQHRALAKTSLDMLSETLKRDMYDLRAPSYSIENVQPPAQDLLAPLKYSCTYWVDHVLDSKPLHGDMLTVQGPLQKFLEVSYLFWLEAMSLLRSMSPAVMAMRKLTRSLQVRCCSFACLQARPDVFAARGNNRHGRHCL